MPPKPLPNTRSWKQEEKMQQPAPYNGCSDGTPPPSQAGTAAQFGPIRPRRKNQHRDLTDARTGGNIGTRSHIQPSDAELDVFIRQVLKPLTQVPAHLRETPGAGAGTGAGAQQPRLLKRKSTKRHHTPTQNPLTKIATGLDRRKLIVRSILTDDDTKEALGLLWQYHTWQEGLARNGIVLLEYHQKVVKKRLGEASTSTTLTQVAAQNKNCSDTLRAALFGTKKRKVATGFATSIMCLLAIGIPLLLIFWILKETSCELAFETTSTDATGGGEDGQVAVAYDAEQSNLNRLATTAASAYFGVRAVCRKLAPDGLTVALNQFLNTTGTYPNPKDPNELLFDLGLGGHADLTIAPGFCGEPDIQASIGIHGTGNTATFSRPGTLAAHTLFQATSFPALPAASPLSFVPVFDIRKATDAMDLPLALRIPLNQDGIDVNDPSTTMAIAPTLGTTASVSETHLTINGLPVDIVNTAAHFGFKVETDFGLPGTTFSTNVTAEIQQCGTWQSLSALVTGTNVPTTFRIDTDSCPILYSLSNTSPCAPLSCYKTTGSRFHTFEATPTVNNGFYYTGLPETKMNITTLARRLSTAQLCFDPTRRPFGISFGQAGSIGFTEFNITDVSASDSQVLPPIVNTFNPPTTPALTWPAISEKAPGNTFNPFDGFAFHNPNHLELVAHTITGDGNLYIPGYAQFGYTFQKTARWETLEADLAGATYTVPPHASGKNSINPLSSLVSYPNGDSDTVATSIEACGPYREPIVFTPESSTTTNVFAQPFASVNLFPAIPEDASQEVNLHVFPGDNFGLAGSANFTGSLAAAESFLRSTQMFNPNPIIGETQHSNTSFSLAYDIFNPCSPIVTTWGASQASIHSVDHEQLITGIPAAISIPPTGTTTQVFPSVELEEQNTGQRHTSTLTVNNICGSITRPTDPISATLKFDVPSPWALIDSTLGVQQWNMSATEAETQAALRAITAQATDLDALAGAGANDAFADTCRSATFCYGAHSGVNICRTAQVFRRFPPTRRLDDMASPSGLLPFFDLKRGDEIVSAAGSKHHSPAE